MPIKNNIISDIYLKFRIIFLFDLKYLNEWMNKLIKYSKLYIYTQNSCIWLV
jgi:hypothetical protein